MPWPAADVREVLIPSLRPGDIVILDNHGVQKNDRALALIAQAEAEVRFQPACSPDLNPSEMRWSKVKELGEAFFTWHKQMPRSVILPAELKANPKAKTKQPCNAPTTPGISTAAVSSTSSTDRTYKLHFRGTAGYGKGGKRR